VTTVTWYLIGMIGAGSMAALGGTRRARAGDGARKRTAAAMVWVRSWYRRRREIRLLNCWYASDDALEGGSSNGRRTMAGLMLGTGPVAATLGAVVAAVAAVSLDGALIAVGLVGAALVAIAALWRTAAALAMAANILGLFALVVSRSTGMPRTDDVLVVVGLAALAALVGMSAIVRSLRQPPCQVDLGPAPSRSGPTERPEGLRPAA
jgi:hypothetical protein